MLRLIVLLSLLAWTEASTNSTVRCPPGSIPPTHAPDQSLCYMFVNQSKTFDDAEAYCSQQNGHLTTVNDMFTEYFLGDQAVSYFPSAASFWIGAHVVNYTSDVWLWTKNNGFLNFTDWKNAADATPPVLGKCAAVTLTDLFWAVVSCKKKMPFVCQVPGVTNPCDSGYTYYGESNMCYKLFSFMQEGQEHSFNQSESVCQADGGHLVSIHSTAENTFVSSLAPGRATNDSMHLWIGASSDGDGDYSWTDGSPSNYSNFDSFGAFARRCTVLYSDGDSDGSRRMQWYGGYYCSGMAFGRFICKKPLSSQ